MNEITITMQEYKDLIKAQVEYDQLRNLLQHHLEQGCGIYSDNLDTLCRLYRIEVKQDA